MSVDDDGVPDAGSTRRGILTDNYTVAPFFEYYKKTHHFLYRFKKTCKKI